MKHVPALDGVRGVAVLLVMLFHLHVPGFSWGWAGVPLFFVLSGYLITGLLLEASASELPRYLSVFYMKRCLRIFPLYYGYLLVNLALLQVVKGSADGYLWYLAYLQNHHIGQALHEGGNIPGVVGHTWSLAVEEQFYMVWPLVVYFVSRRWLAVLCLALIVAAPLFRYAILQATGNPFLTNVMLPSCLDMLAFGSLLAVLREAGPAVQRSLGLAAWVGLAVTVATIWALGPDALWTPAGWTRDGIYLYTTIGLAAGLLIGSNGQGPAALQWALRSRWLVYTGRISYGLYIWHLLVIKAVKMGLDRIAFQLPGFLQALLCLGASYVVASASYHFFEIHFLRIKDRRYSAAATGQ
jgi:peptidoglycan/LPS O-acetylase OafA/YrhL